MDDEKYRNGMNNAIQMIWDHIYISWCSRKEDQFEYCKYWLCKSVKGIKNRTALYLKNSMEGVGKGVICNFLLDHVFGSTGTL
eukprot:gene2905-3620_t